jgi:hypothetical protein
VQTDRESTLMDEDDTNHTVFLFEAEARFEVEDG